LSVPGHLPALEPATARALWFACAEGLANARKHAAGSPVSVTVEVTDVVTLSVDDRGEGGADERGTGLASLADRMASVGGALHVTSGSSGTRLSARVPARHDVVPLMPGPASPVTVKT
jgi:signal transduction histidine kinase